MSQVEAILDALEKAGAKLTGSWARGEEHAGSDFDFWVAPSKWRAFVRSAPKEWESCTAGHIAWRTREVGLIEASDIFRPTPKGQRLMTRTALGRKWKTR